MRTNILSNFMRKLTVLLIYLTNLPILVCVENFKEYEQKLS